MTPRELSGLELSDLISLWAERLDEHAQQQARDSWGLLKRGVVDLLPQGAATAVVDTPSGPHIAGISGQALHLVTGYQHEDRYCVWGTRISLVQARATVVRWYEQGPYDGRVHRRWTITDHAGSTELSVAAVDDRPDNDLSGAIANGLGWKLGDF